MANPKKFLKEFQEFAVKGNVVDLAVAVVIGAAFGKIVSSFVADIIMPPLGLLMGGLNFSDIKIVLKKAAVSVNGAATPAVSINIGTFLQNVIDFLIVATAIFFMVKLISRLKAKLRPLIAAEEKKEDEVKPLTKDQELLVEIRDLLESDRRS